MMGMSIDNSISLLEDYLEWQKLHKMDGTGIDEATRNLLDVARKYQMMQADYKNRLKADMVAMLTEIQLEIEGLEVPLLYLAEDYEGGVLDCKKIIQQKINALKGDQDAEV
jgi:hypothetical protein